MTNICVHCFTNLDLRAEQWPEQLPCLPNVGDEIESKTRHTTFNGGVFVLSLEVVKIRWRYKKDLYPGNEYYSKSGWYAEIELHDRKTFKRSIRQFYEWYAPLVGQSVSYFI